jgi:hypothetical protein
VRSIVSHSSRGGDGNEIAQVAFLVEFSLWLFGAGEQFPTKNIVEERPDESAR